MLNYFHSDAFFPNEDDFNHHALTLSQDGVSDLSMVRTVSSGSSVESKYFTPRTLSAVESLEASDVLNSIPVVARTSIWSTSYKRSQIDSLSVPEHNSVTPFFSGDVAYNRTRRLSDEINAPNFNNDAATYSYNNKNNNVVAYNNYADCSNDYSAPITPVSPIKQAYYAPLKQPEAKFRSSRLTFRSYKGKIFTIPPKSKFFVIKSYNILDVTSSFTHNIWTSTDLGNKRLNKAYKELRMTGDAEVDGKIFLFFSVNASGKFCGVSEMKDCIDFTKTSYIWVEQTRWKGEFPVEWLLIKDVPNRYFQHLKVPTNEFKPVTNSRDTQEIPFDIGISMLKIISSFKTNT